MSDLHSLLRDAKAGKFAPVSVLVGTERFLIDRAVAALRHASIADSPAGFNDDVFHGKQLSAGAFGQVANTLPMFARARFVLVRDIDAIAAAEWDGLADYLSSPSPSTCVVMIGEKLDGRSKFAKLAKQQNVLYDVAALKGDALRRFAQAEAEARGHRIDARALESLLDAIGQDLAALDDALERLSLYVGDGKPIDEAAVEACVSRVRVETIWSLVDAVSDKNARVALVACASLLADREPPLRILAMVARQLRMIAKMRDALASGLRPPEAAKEAGAPPFKASELASSAKRFSAASLVSAFRVLADTDAALKGSKRPPEIVLEEALLRLCA